MKVDSLKTKMAVAVSVLVVILVLVMSCFAFTYFERTFKEAIADQEFTLVTTMAEQIDNKFDTVHTALL